jgi:POT family proton-dependent oligopeptide transporter
MGRKKFAHIPPAGWSFFTTNFNRENIAIIARLYVIFAFVAVFWALFDQTASSWVLQAQKMDLHWLGMTWTAEQIQVLNPLFILIFIPIFSYVIYPLADKVFLLTPLRKIGLGFFVAIPSFLIPAWVEMRIGHGEHPSIMWQALSYAIITAAEVLTSITSLEFSYTQAPKRMKSLIMAFYLTSVTLGDLFVAGVNKFIQNPDGTTKLAGANYYLFFAAVLFVSAVIYIFVARVYQPKTFIQDETPEPA